MNKISESKIFNDRNNLVGELLTAAIASLVFMACAALYVTPRFEYLYHGEVFASLSEDLGQRHNLRLRILGPLLGYISGLRGDKFIFLPLLAAWAASVALYFWARSSQLSRLSSAAVSMMFVFSTPVLFVLFLPGYTDTLTYLLLILAVLARRKAILFALCTTLMLFNHEASVIYLPFLLAISLLEKPSRLLVQLPVALCGWLAWLGLRWRFQASFVDVAHFDFYLNWERVYRMTGTNAPGLGAAYFYAFKYFWLIPILGLILSPRSKESALIVILLVCASAQLLVADDGSRLIAAAFPCLLLGSVCIISTLGEKFFLGLAIVLQLVTLITVHYYIGQSRPFRCPGTIPAVIDLRS
jgi:hypothetical protein